jgi:hypothetical protein
VSPAEITAIRAARPAAPATSKAAFISWRTGVVSLVLLIWLVPIKRYNLPVRLPFHLEPYRLWILALVVALGLAVVFRGTRLSAAGHAKPVLLLAVAALGAQVANNGEISANGLQTEALKSLSYFLSFLVAFVLVTSTIKHREEINAVVQALVIGGTIVAIAALIESKTHHNYFNDLHRWFPFLSNTGQDKYAFRGGRLRVRASAQHPIALAAALLITAPLAVYLSRQALSKVRSHLWLLAGLVLTAAAVATVSRTAILMLGAMTVTALFFRWRELLRRWPLLIVLLGVTHLAAPGAIGHLYQAFQPKGGILQQQTQRTGQRGSGRFSDFGPGLVRWSHKPIVGRGLGTSPSPTEPAALQGVSSDVRVIYDDQYLTTLISLGGLGIVGIIWFVWGAAVKLGKAARRTVGGHSDLLVAATISIVGFGAGMLTYDAFSFVQVSLLAFVICGLGLRARSLAEND